MGRITGVFATSHILMGSPDADSQARSVVAGMNEIGRRLRACAPDLVVVIGSDHMFNITLKLQPPFCVGTADSFTTFGDMDVPRRTLPGQPGFARALCVRAADGGFDLAQTEEYAPDHGIAIPLWFALPDGDVPIVPVLVNVNMTPMPTPGRCAALARVIADAIERDLPADASVVILATGGLSHWLNIPGHGSVSEEFDHWFLARLEAADLGALEGLTTAEIQTGAGNGGLEVVNWIMAAALAPGQSAERLYYEPMPQWLTGMAGIAFTGHPAAARAADRPRT